MGTKVKITESEYIVNAADDNTKATVNADHTGAARFAPTVCLYVTNTHTFWTASEAYAIAAQIVRAADAVQTMNAEA